MYLKNINYGWLHLSVVEESLVEACLFQIISDVEALFSSKSQSWSEASKISWVVTPCSPIL